MKYQILIIIFFVCVQGCKVESSNHTNEIKAEYPDGKKGNYVTLNESLIQELNLTEERLKEIQFYTANDINISVIIDKSLTNDTQTVKTKPIFIKKFTPCVITKKMNVDNGSKQRSSEDNIRYKNYTQDELNTLLKFESTKPVVQGIYIERVYEVDLGDGLSLVYDPTFKFFTRVSKFENRNIISTSSFINNAGLLFQISNPIVRSYSEDTIKVTGKRK